MKIETPEKIEENEDDTNKKELIKERTELVKSLEGETFSFPGMSPERYQAALASDADLAEMSYMKGRYVPVDEQIEKLNEMRVVISNLPGNFNIFVLPLDPTSIIELDGILVSDLDENNATDPRLKKLILMVKQ